MASPNPDKDKPTGLMCPLCHVQACREEPGTRKPPPFCPAPAKSDLLESVANSYVEREELRVLAQASARTESGGYGKTTRIEDVMDFARRIGANKLGIAHCVGLRHEARIAREIFEAGGFQVEAVCCKVGSIPKERLGLTDADKVRPGQFEPACNPAAQAALLAEAGTELNVVMGLCVGHDSLFFMHSKAPATVLIAKDRVLGHNPAAALYTSHSYYKRLV